MLGADGVSSTGAVFAGAALKASCLTTFGVALGVVPSTREEAGGAAGAVLCAPWGAVEPVPTNSDGVASSESDGVPRGGVTFTAGVGTGRAICGEGTALGLEDWAGDDAAGCGTVPAGFAFPRSCVHPR